MSGADDQRMRANDQRDLRHKRARDVGREFAQRARGAMSLEEEKAIAERWRLWPHTGDQAVSGLYEPDLRANSERINKLVAKLREKPVRRSWWSRVVARFAIHRGQTTLTK